MLENKFCLKFKKHFLYLFLSRIRANLEFNLFYWLTKDFFLKKMNFKQNGKHGSRFLLLAGNVVIINSFPIRLYLYRSIDCIPHSNVIEFANKVWGWKTPGICHSHPTLPPLPILPPPPQKKKNTQTKNISSNSFDVKVIR